ncbi:MAG: helix-turn-helix domain-containing protein [Firmicutes bacterium]|nr:helix-turn-helix domain-containing protein [Bacillota bacterium]
MKKYFEELIMPLTVFWKSTGMSISILDHEGSILHRIGGHCEFCRMIRQEEVLDDKCRSLHCMAGKYSGELGDSYIYGCHAELVSISLGLYKGKRYMGSIMAGPVSMEYPDGDLMDSIIRKCGLPQGARPLLFDAFKSVYQTDPEILYYVSQLLANLIYPAMSYQDSEFLSRHRRITLQQEMISEAIQDQNRSNDAFTVIEKKQKELCNMIVSWDDEGATEVLSDILGNLYQSSGGDIEVIKLQAGELIGFVVSDMYRRGLSDGSVYDEIASYRSKIAVMDDVSQISLELEILVKKLTDIMRKSLKPDLNQVVKDCLNYIRIHYREKISLTQTASSIGVSPTHLSRLFNEEMGQGFTDYINSYRMERARELLTESKLTLSEIAQVVGYSNQQYFSKVFKDITGVTPGYYRNND